MKVCLIRPTVASRFQITAPLSLGYLSASLKKNGYNDIYLIDGTLHLLSIDDTINMIKKNGITDVIGIQVYTGSQKWTRDFVLKAKEEFPQSKIVVGGPHISSLKGFALEFIGADYGVLGEGEDSIVDFVKFVEGKINSPYDVDGLIFKEGSSFIHAKNMYGFLKNADDIPIPDWELLKPYEYFEYMESATMPLRGKKPIVILTSRGCPYQCTFCSSGLTNQRKMRYRSPENIVDEIEFLQKKYKIDEVFFTDDNLTMNLRRAEKIFDLMIERDIKVHWRAPNGLRVDRLSESLIEKMSKSGCYYVGLGIESGSEIVLKSIKKKLNLEKVASAVNLLHKYNIQTTGFFICGLIGENEEDINETLNFAKKVNFDRVQIGVYIPYPGSEDFNNLTYRKSLDEYRQIIMNFQENEELPKWRDIPLEKLLKLQQKFILKFYLRPKVILSMLMKIRISQIKAFLNHPWIKSWFTKKEKSLFGN